MIELKSITKKYNKGKRNELTVLKECSLKIDTGEMVAITGKSGAGKSTLLHIIACIDDYDGGEYYYNSRLIKYIDEKQLAYLRNEEIGLIMQDFALVEDFTVLENVMIPLDFRGGYSKKEKKEASLKALKALKIDDLADKYVKTSPVVRNSVLQLRELWSRE